MTRLIPFLLICSLCASARASDVWLGPSATGSGSGADSSDLLAEATYNASPGTYSFAGFTTHLVGVLSATLDAAVSGTPGNPIIFHFETGAGFSSPCWITYGKAISVTTQHDLTFDGGVNGYITATANGIGLANQVGCTGIYCYNDCSRIIIENLAITNMYVFSGSTFNANGAGGGVTFSAAGGIAAGNVVSNCVFHDENTGVEFAYGPGWSNMSMIGCTAYNCNWGGGASDSAGATLSGLTVSGNHFYNWQVWDDSADSYHHNGFYAYAANSGSTLTGVVVSGNLVGPGFSTAGHSTSGIFVSGNVTSLIYNNIFLGTDGTAPANAFLVLGGYGGGQALNNTFIGGQNGVGLQCSEGTGARSTVYYVTNNIFLNLPTYIAQYNRANFTYIGGYNLFYGSQSVQPFVWSTTGTGVTLDFSDWITAYDGNYQIGNPLLNSSYAPLSGSAAIGAGANLTSMGIAGLGVDANGIPRPSGTNAWTIGALGLTSVGSLVTVISPANAVAAGAQWQVDGGTYETNGTILTNVTVRQHVVSFKAIAGWIMPVGQSVLISTNSLTSVSGTYTNIPQTGGLQVTILPANAVAAGAAWQTNGGPFLPSGTVLNPVPSGSYIVSFNTNTANWTPPPSETLVITNGAFTQVTNLYSTYGLHVIVSPTNDLNGLVGWWTLDDLSGTDLSGNGNTMTFVGSPTSVLGEMTNGVSFNGSSQSADAGSGASLNPAAITVMAWVNFNSFTPSYSAVVSKVNSSTNAFYQILVRNTGKLAVYVSGTGGWAYYDGTGSNALSTDMWNHIAFTYSSAAGLVGYVNGQQDGTAATQGVLQSNSADTTIGSDLHVSGRLVNAIIDDVRIYNRSLSTGEIANQYQWPTGGRPQ